MIKKLQYHCRKTIFSLHLWRLFFYSFIVSHKYFHLLWKSSAACLAASKMWMVQLHVVLSIAAVLAVHKLLSCLPYCATPSVAQTSCRVLLVSLLYTSKQSAERITTWRELEIIAGQTSTASLCCVCCYLRLNPPCCRGRDRRDRQRWKRHFLHRSDLCLLLDLSPIVEQTCIHILVGASSVMETVRMNTV